MGPFNALFDEFKGVFGKAYFLAGFIPAAVLVGGLLAYFSDASIGEIVSTLAEELGKETWTTSALAVAAISVLGLVFFALRGGLMQLVQTLDLPGLASLRHWMIARQVEAFQQANNLQSRHILEYTVLSRWVTDLNFDKPERIPLWCKPLSTRAMKLRSQMGLASLRSHLSDQGRESGKIPSRKLYESVSEALRHLYVYRYRRDDWEVLRQIATWRTLLVKKPAITAIEHMADIAYRNWVTSNNPISGFPTDTKWIAPTQLGNQAASLDDYAESRYGADTSIVVSRLNPLIADTDREQLIDAKIGVETSLNLMVTFAIVLFVALGDSLYLTFKTIATFGIAGSELNWRAILTILVSLLAVRVFYFGARYAYASLADRIRRIVDLNRLKVLHRFGLPIPKDLAAEKQVWRDFSNFLKSGSPMNPVPPLTNNQDD